MTTIIKSDLAYTGSLVLQTVDQVSQTAQDAYNAYAARVAADGGVIINPAATLAAFVWAKSQNLLRDAVAVSASWGVRKDGANLISKMYGLNAVDFVTSAGKSALTHDSTGAFPVALYPATDSYLTTENAAVFVKGSRYAMVWAAKHADAGANRRMSMGYANEVAGSNSYFSIHASLNDNSPYSAYILASNNSTRAANLDGPYVAYTASGGYVDDASQTVVPIKNGVFGVGVSPVAGTTYQKFALLPAGKISLGLIRESGVMVGATKGGSAFAEAWLINNCTQEQARLLSVRLDGLY